MTVHAAPSHRIPDLKDPSLLVSQAYVAGEWIDAPDGKTIAVTDPADGALIVNVPDLGPDIARRAIDKAHEVQKEWAQAHRQGAQRHLKVVVRPHDRRMPTTRAHPHHRAGQAPRRGQGRDHLRRRLSSSGSRKRPSASTATSFRRHAGRQAHHGAQAAGRCVRRDHAVELSQRR